MIELNGPWFIEKETNRTITFHGINVGGGAKLPVDIPSHASEGFWVDYDRKVTFIGRPFPLADADLHFQRLVSLGFNLLRFIITWEAIEHEGPGIYDLAYLDYVIALLKKCEHYGLRVYIDPHQDTWSRQCGGAGHPGWTLALAGLNPLNFNSTVAALVHNTYTNPEGFPKMIWNTNYERLAAGTMFTLFFAGKTFAPQCIVNQVNIQDYLQTHYLNAMMQLASRILQHGLEDKVVLGYDTMNEPGQGYLGSDHLDTLDDSDISFKMGLMPTPFQGMLLASGIPTKVANYEFIWSGPKKTSDVLVNPNDNSDSGSGSISNNDNNNNHMTTTSAWLTQKQVDRACMIFGWRRGPCWEKAGCIWEQHGVWNRATRSLTVPHYFAFDPATGKQTCFAKDYWLPFLSTYIKAIRSIHKHAIIFVQPPILRKPPKLPTTADNPLYQRLVYTPHWYDGLTLVKKKWCNYNIDFINLNRGQYGTGPLRFIRAMCFGETGIRKCFIKQMETIRAEGLEQIGNYPCLLGETGIPYDMEDKALKKSTSTSTSTSASVVPASTTTTTCTRTSSLSSPSLSDSAATVKSSGINTILLQLLSLCQYLWLWVISFVSTITTSAMPVDHTLPPTPIYDINTPDSPQNKAMGASLHAVESTLLNYTLWQYVPDNDPLWGDLWNGEDLSIWQQQHESSAAEEKNRPADDDDNDRSSNSSISSWTESTTSTLIGGIVAAAASAVFGSDDHKIRDSNRRDLVCLHRPHPRLTAGRPISISFTSPTTKIPAYYRYSFEPTIATAHTVTEIFVPSRTFPPPTMTTIGVSTPAASPDATATTTPTGITQVSVSRGKWAIHRVLPDYWLLHWWWSDEDRMDRSSYMVLELKGGPWLV